MRRRQCKMSRGVTIKLEEVRRVYDLIAKIHYFFHQPLHYPDVEKFATEHYPEMKEVYYQVVWDWLPEDVQADVMER